ncbi:hypothetical protein RJT34_11160 [Clitoria ternatea]|uniref:Uncharacterized protein n=1 Tax=Clitoria ternatea TaxID=43366 RepID=A0AAN9PK92_CLITE
MFGWFGMVVLWVIINHKCSHNVTLVCVSTVFLFLYELALCYESDYVALLLWELWLGRFDLYCNLQLCAYPFHVKWTPTIVVWQIPITNLDASSIA